MHYRYTVGFFVDQHGSKPIEAYLFDERNLTDISTLINVIQRLALIGLDILDTHMARHLEGPVYELRKDRHRILFAPDGSRFVLLSAFIKRTQKTPPEEIDRALDRFGQYQRSRSFFELKLPPLP
jgi:phage-related protein